MNYRFSAGDKVRVCAAKNSSQGAQQHSGEIVTIKNRCTFTYAYELIELEGLWHDRCLKEITA